MSETENNRSNVGQLQWGVGCSGRQRPSRSPDPQSPLPLPHPLEELEKYLQGCLPIPAVPLGPEGTRMRAPWAAASGPPPHIPFQLLLQPGPELSLGPQESALGLWLGGACVHTCRAGEAWTTGAHRLSQASPALHLSGSTCCGINPVALGKLGEGGKALPSEAFVCSTSSQRKWPCSGLVIHPQAEHRTHSLPTPTPCPQARDAHSASGFGFYSVRTAGTSKACPQNQPPHSLPLLRASFLVPAPAGNPHPHPHPSLCNLAHRSPSLPLSSSSWLHVWSWGPKARPSIPNDLLCNLSQAPATSWTLILTGTKWSCSGII